MELIQRLERQTLAIVQEFPHCVMLYVQCLDTSVNPCQHRQVKNPSEGISTTPNSPILYLEMNDFTNQNNLFANRHFENPTISLLAVNSE